jgi:hypothetical protein
MATAITSVQSVSATVGSTRCPISVADRKPREDRGAEIAVQQRPRPRAEAHEERIVEPQVRPDLGDVVVGRGVTRDDRSGIAGREVEQREDDERDHRHDDEGREQATEDIGEQGC